MTNFKFLKSVIILFMLYIFVFPKSSLASEYTQVASYTKDNLTITSYSNSWDEDKLKQLYDELLKNFISSEFEYLKNIYIYPNSPYGVNGHYSEDVNIVNGEYTYGENSFISLYNGEKYTTVYSIAPTLAHEYGHHYTMFHLLTKEGVYYNNMINSKYATIRQINKFPSYSVGSYSSYEEYHWDILELLADDYVQLLGSANAKASKDYKSVDELITNDSLNNYGTYFNLKPSINPYIPLAAEVPGLYSYLLELGGYTGNSPSLKEYPILSNVEVSKTSTNEFSYKINWTEAVGNSPFEYTLVMYPSSNPMSPIPLKTVQTGEKLETIFGSYEMIDENNTLLSISNLYEGEFKIKLFIKDCDNFIFETKPITFDFNKASNFLQKEPLDNSTVVTTHTTPISTSDKSTVNTQTTPIIQSITTVTSTPSQKILIGPKQILNLNLKTISFPKKN